MKSVLVTVFLVFFTILTVFGIVSYFGVVSKSCGGFYYCISKVYYYTSYNTTFPLTTTCTVFCFHTKTYTCTCGNSTITKTKIITSTKTVTITYIYSYSYQLFSNVTGSINVRCSLYSYWTTITYKFQPCLITFSDYVKFNFTYLFTLFPCFSISEYKLYNITITTFYTTYFHHILKSTLFTSSLSTLTFTILLTVSNEPIIRYPLSVCYYPLVRVVYCMTISELTSNNIVTILSNISEQGNGVTISLLSSSFSTFSNFLYGYFCFVIGSSGRFSGSNFGINLCKPLAFLFYKCTAKPITCTNVGVVFCPFNLLFNNFDIVQQPVNLKDNYIMLYLTTVQGTVSGTCTSITNENSYQNKIPETQHLYLYVYPSIIYNSTSIGYYYQVYDQNIPILTVNNKTLIFQSSLLITCNSLVLQEGNTTFFSTFLPISSTILNGSNHCISININNLSVKNVMIKIESVFFGLALVIFGFITTRKFSYIFDYYTDLERVMKYLFLLTILLFIFNMSLSYTNICSMILNSVGQVYFPAPSLFDEFSILINALIISIIVISIVQALTNIPIIGRIFGTAIQAVTLGLKIAYSISYYSFVFLLFYFLFLIVLRGALIFILPLIKVTFLVFSLRFGLGLVRMILTENYSSVLSDSILFIVVINGIYILSSFLSPVNPALSLNFVNDFSSVSFLLKDTIILTTMLFLLTLYIPPLKFIHNIISRIVNNVLSFVFTF